MQEELIAFVPVLLLLTRRLGFTSLVAVAMSLGAARWSAPRSARSIPFQVGIAQKVAELELVSRLAVPARPSWSRPWLIWIAGDHAAMPGALGPRPRPVDGGRPEAGAGWRQAAVLGMVLADVRGLRRGRAQVRLGLRSLAALFFLMGVVAGLIGGLGITRHGGRLRGGFRSMAFAALLIGFARGDLRRAGRGAASSTPSSTDCSRRSPTLPTTVAALA